MNARTDSMPDSSPAASIRSLVSLLVAMLTLLIVISYPIEIIQHYDSPEYIEQASTSLLSSDFYFSLRALAYPLILKLLHLNLTLTVILQLVLFCLCYSLFILEFITGTNRRSSKFAILLLLLFIGLHPDMWGVYKIILPESIMISSWIACLYLLYRYSLCQTPATLSLIFCLCTLQLILHDRQIFLTSLILPLLCIPDRKRSLSRSLKFSYLATLIVFIFFANYCANNISNSFRQTRWLPQMMNNIGTRVYPDEELRAYFIKHGAPLREPQPYLEGKTWYDNSYFMGSDPALQSLRDWVYHHGKTTYALALLVHPSFTITHFLRDVDKILGLTGFGYANWFTPYNSWLKWYPSNLIIFSLLITMIILQALTGRFTLDRTNLVAMYLILASLLYGAICYFGDPLDIPRHCIITPISLKLLLSWIAIHNYRTLTETAP